MRPLTIQASGMGQQSIALYLLGSLGHIPRFDFSVFSDPGSEKTKTYQYIENILIPWSKKNNGIPIVHLKEKDLKIRFTFRQKFYRSALCQYSSLHPKQWHVTQAVCQ